MNWKIRRDPYLRPLAEKHGESAVMEAGFFFDDDPADAALDDVDWLCTPTELVRRNLAARSTIKPLVLVSTGGFFPVHAGHVAMMTAARRAASLAGSHVVGGYLSPGHDVYIRHKRGAVAVGASDRLAMAVEALADSDWLSVDPWEAMARRVAVNFTDVTYRLERYLQAHLDPRIEVSFVCGGDNARFALAFGEVGRCIVVGRPGSEAEYERWRQDPRVPDDGRILWADGNHAEASSHLEPGPRPRVQRVRLRLEDTRAVAGLGLSDSIWRGFQAGLCEALGRYMDVDARAPQPAVDSDAPVLSLDPFAPGTVDLGISRLFELGGYRLLGHVPRPGTRPLSDQLEAVKPGQWIVRDDDRATGSTIEFLGRELPSSVTITGLELAVEDDGAEIADSRDFLVGTAHGGLAVALPNGRIGRVPYLLPYADPCDRAGVPADQALDFARELWSLNHATFSGTGLCVGDLEEHSAAAFLLAGYGRRAELEVLCRQHADRLGALIDY